MSKIRSRRKRKRIAIEKQKRKDFKDLIEQLDYIYFELGNKIMAWG